MDLDDFNKLTLIASDMALKTDTKEFVKKLFENKTLQEIQAMDPIAEWEKAMGGISHKQNSKVDDMSMLGFVSAFNQEKTSMLSTAKETNNSTNFEDFLNLMQQRNFKFAYATTYTIHDRKEMEVIMYDEKNGFIIHATSYAGSINSANLYGEIAPNGYNYRYGDERLYPEVKELYDLYYNDMAGTPLRTIEDYISSGIVRLAGVPARASSSPITDKRGFYAFDFDMREGAIAKLDKLQMPSPFFRTVPQWESKSRFLWLLNPAENSKTYKEISSNKIASSPQLMKIVNDPERFKNSPSTSNYSDSWKEI